MTSEENFPWLVGICLIWPSRKPFSDLKIYSIQMEICSRLPGKDIYSPPSMLLPVFQSSQILLDKLVKKSPKLS